VHKVQRHCHNSNSITNKHLPQLHAPVHHQSSCFMQCTTFSTVSDSDDGIVILIPICKALMHCSVLPQPMQCQPGQTCCTATGQFAPASTICRCVPWPAIMGLCQPAVIVTDRQCGRVKRQRMGFCLSKWYGLMVA